MYSRHFSNSFKEYTWNAYSTLDFMKFFMRICKLKSFLLNIGQQWLILEWYHLNLSWWPESTHRNMMEGWLTGAMEVQRQTQHQEAQAKGVKTQETSYLFLPEQLTGRSTGECFLPSIYLMSDLSFFEISIDVLLD